MLPCDASRPAVSSQGIEAELSHWDFVLGAYAVATLVLAGYWSRVERRIRALKTLLRDGG